MAEAKRTIIEQEVTETKKVPAVTLTLTVEEAETLMAVGAKVGGDRYTSPRKHYEAVTKALRNAGVRDFTASGPHPYKHLEPYSPGVNFSEKPTRNSSSAFRF
ncbi:hypothetical protein [Streptomyces sp. NPDC002324]